jgi:hypothetical protein
MKVSYSGGETLSNSAYTLVLPRTIQRVVEKGIYLLIRFGRRRVALTIGHGYSVGISKESVDLDAAIKDLPSLRLIFRTA